MKRAFKIIINKYVLALLFMVVWMTFFDEVDFFTQKDRLSTLHQLEKKATYYQKEIEIANQDLIDIQNNDEAIEKFAREKYLMKKSGEDIYLIEEVSNN